ncbi:MAG: adenylate/guanylate cyclase domain-containing protein [Anaerolineae bacterium]|nr:adenylate/guanylate cyclase domain-containing protein [Anaerolineae bacterium]
MLTWLLFASRTGLFDLNWELRCVHCSGITQRTSRMGELPSEVNCPSCHMHSSGHLDNNVIVTFTLSPQVRKTEPSMGVFLPAYAEVLGEYDAGQTIVLDLQNPIEHYLLDAGSLRLLAAFTVDPQHEYVPTLLIDCSQWGTLPPQRFVVGVGQLSLTVRNVPGRVVAGYRKEIGPEVQPDITGLEAAMLPAFEQLFNQEGLSQRESLAVRNLALMFTDITGSTALYQRLGDVRAYNLVRDHFSVLFREIEANNGTIVKTIGDAVMAAFLTPEDALRAGLAVQQAIRAFNQGRTAEQGVILVKIGIHMGSAIAVNLNNRLDYFGNMVNLAARIQGKSRSEEILLSQQVYHDAQVQAILQNRQDIRISDSVFELAGIEETQRLFSVAYTTR